MRENYNQIVIAYNQSIEAELLSREHKEVTVDQV